MAISKSGLFPCFKLKRGPDHQDEQCSAHTIPQLRGILNCRSIKRKYVLSLTQSEVGNNGFVSYNARRWQHWHIESLFRSYRSGCETVIFPVRAPLLSPNFGSVQQVTPFSFIFHGRQSGRIAVQTKHCSLDQLVSAEPNNSLHQTAPAPSQAHAACNRFQPPLTQNGKISYHGLTRQRQASGAPLLGACGAAGELKRWAALQLT